MAATLDAWDGERPRDVEHAAELFDAIEARAEEGALPSSPLIDRFVDEMLSVWPNIGGDDGIDMG